MRLPALATCVLLLALPTAGALSVLGLVSVPGGSSGEAIIGYRDGSLPDVLSLVRSTGATVVRTHEALRIVVVQTNDLVGFLATTALGIGVEYVEKNDDIAAHGAQWNGAQWNGAQWNGAQWNGQPGSQAEGQWGTQAIGAPTAWLTSEGERRAILCVLDSGLAWDHPDIAPNAWTGADGTRGFNAIDPQASAYDDAGHGTHVSGIAAATVADSSGMSGVGNVQIMPVKVLTADGTGKEDDLALGIVWCANHGADVVLMALGVDEDGPTLRKAIRHAVENDVLLVASAGNGGCDDCVGYPARDKGVLAVSALTQDDRIAPFSSRGAEIALAAPGVDIVGPLPGGAFGLGSGTSQAAAFVAGAAALVRDADPGLSAAQTRAILESSARDLRDPLRFGHGALDVGAALAES